MKSKSKKDEVKAKIKTKVSEVELTPNPSFLIQALRCIGYPLETALADIIDNSISARASRISIQYRWNGGEPWLAILDDGSGMSSVNLREALRFGGRSSPSDARASNDLGRFGLGLKTASLSQCRQVTVVSKFNGQINALEWDVDALSTLANRGWVANQPSVFQLKSDNSISGIITTLEGLDSGTAVIWRKIDGLVSNSVPGISETHFSSAMSRAQEHIRTVFHRFLFPDMENDKALEIDFNGTVLEAFDPFGKSSPSRQELPEEIIQINGEHILVQPFILPHYSKSPRQEYDKLAGEDGYLHNQGFYIYRNKRLIFKGSWFRLVARTELTKLVRVRVDFPNTLDHLWQLDVKKSQAQPPKVVLDELKRFIDKATERGKLTYIRRAARLSESVVPVWRRDFSEGKVAYTINPEHPFVRNLIDNERGEIDHKKLAVLHVIAEAFPREAFHADSNTDKIEFTESAGESERISVVREFVLALRNSGYDLDAARQSVAKAQMPISEEILREILREEFYG